MVEGSQARMDGATIPSARSSISFLRSPWTTLAIFVILMLLSFFDRQLLALLLVPIQTDLGLSDVELGLVSGIAFTIFYCSVGLLLGWAVDRYPKRWLLFVGVVFWSAATMACGLATSFPQLFGARLLVGFGEAVVAPCAFSVLTSIFARHRLALVMSIFAGATNLGAAVIFIGGGAFIAFLNSRGPIELPILGVLHPWQASFILIGAPGALFALLAFLINDRPRSDQPLVPGANAGVSLLSFLRAHKKLLILHTGAYTAACMNAYTMIPWAPAFLERTYQLDIFRVGLVVGVSNGLCGFLGNVFWGFMADRQIKRGRVGSLYTVYTIAQSLGVVSALTTLLVHNVIVSVIGLCVSWASLFSSGGLNSAYGLITPAHLRGRIGALNSFVMSSFALGLTPLIVGLVTELVYHDRAKVGASIATVIVVCTTVSITLLQLARRPLQEAVARAEIETSSAA